MKRSPYFLLVLLMLSTIVTFSQEKVTLKSTKDSIPKSTLYNPNKDTIVTDLDEKNKIALIKADLLQKKLQMKKRISEERKERRDKKLLEKALAIQEKKAIKEAERKLRKAQKNASNITLLNKNKQIQKERRNEFLKRKDNQKAYAEIIDANRIIRSKELNSKEKILSERKRKQLELAQKIASNKEKIKEERLAIIYQNKEKQISSTKDLKQFKQKEKQSILLQKKKNQIELAKRIASNKERVKEEQLAIIVQNKEKHVNSTEDLKQFKLKEKQSILLQKKKNQLELAEKTTSYSVKKKEEQLATINTNKERLVYATEKTKQNKLKLYKETLLEKKKKQLELAKNVTTESELRKEEQLATILENNLKIVSSNDEIKQENQRIQGNAKSKKHENYLKLNQKIALKKDNIKEAIKFKKEKEIAYRAELDNLKKLIKRRTIARRFEKRVEIQFEIKAKLKEIIAKRNTKFSFLKAKPRYKGEVKKIEQK